MRLRSERDLQRVRSWAVTTLRGLSEAVISVDATGHVVFVNTAAERMLGRPREQLLRRPLGDVFIVRDVDGPPRPPVVELAELGISDSLVRLSVGVEHVEDLWKDLEHGLAKA